MKRLYYVYPNHHNVSFRIVAEQHIEMLKEKFKIEPIPELNYYMINLNRNSDVIIQPFFWGMFSFDEVKWSFFRTWRQNVRNLIAVEVADSDHMGQTWIKILNTYANYLIVNTEYSRNVYLQSGTKIPIFVVPHNYSPKFNLPLEKLKISNEIRLIKQLKEQNGLKYILFFGVHSDYRKGVDLVHEIMKKVQKKNENYYLIYKSLAPKTEFNDIKMLNITGFIPEDDIIALYKISDAVLMPSRGGSFEINGLEGLVSGLPVIAPEKGAWVEYFLGESKKYLAKVSKKVKVFPDNTIHDGYGWEIDIDDAVEKLLYVLDNNIKLDIKEEIDKKYSFDAVKQQLLQIMNNIFG